MKWNNIKRPQQKELHCFASTFQHTDNVLVQRVVCSDTSGESKPEKQREGLKY